MNQEILEKLNSFCADFKSFRANTEDGQGKSLHDIKHTFDYVAKTVDTYHLTGTKFGSNLSEKAKEASQVLSQLWLCLQDLEKSISNFTDNQTNNNNQVGGQGSTSTSTPTTTKSTAEIANEVVEGKWGVGTERQQRLEEAGYNYNEVQSAVNNQMKGIAPSITSPNPQPNPQPQPPQNPYNPPRVGGGEMKMMTR